MAMVWPEPSPWIVPNMTWSIPYAARICGGVYPTGEDAPAGAKRISRSSRLGRNDRLARDQCGCCVRERSTTPSSSCGETRS